MFFRDYCVKKQICCDSTGGVAKCEIKRNWALHKVMTRQSNRLCYKVIFFFFLLLLLTIVKGCFQSYFNKSDKKFSCCFHCYCCRCRCYNWCCNWSKWIFYSCGYKERDKERQTDRRFALTCVYSKCLNNKHKHSKQQVATTNLKRKEKVTVVFFFFFGCFSFIIKIQLLVLPMLSCCISF